jgi:Mg2+-importing ATPase
VFLPFLPMAAVQILLNNLLYDFSQTSVASDDVDPEYLARPRQWDMRAITRFVLFIGPVSSIFDYATFALMWFVFKANAPEHAGLFQTGWFVESLLTQTLIIHIIRTAKIPFIESMASPALVTTSIVISVVGIALPFTWIGASLGFVPLPPLYWPIVIGIIGGYAVLAQLVKTWFVRRWGM